MPVVWTLTSFIMVLVRRFMNCLWRWIYLHYRPILRTSNCWSGSTGIWIACYLFGYDYEEAKITQAVSYLGIDARDVSKWLDTIIHYGKEKEIE